MDVSTPPSDSTTTAVQQAQSMPASPSKSKAVVTASSSGIQPRPLASDDINNASLRPHKSNLPLLLYLLSFAPPLRPQNRKASWKELLSHPYILYALGTLAAIPAGLAFPALDMLYGYWTTGVTADTATDGAITGRGNQVGWIVTLVGFLILFFTWSFLALCKFVISGAPYYELTKPPYNSLNCVSQPDRAIATHLRGVRDGPGRCILRESRSRRD
jgi:hypothetical protein